MQDTGAVTKRKAPQGGVQLCYAKLFPLVAVYVALPVIVFVGTWLKPVIALCAVALAIVGLVFAIRNGHDAAQEPTAPADIFWKRAAKYAGSAGAAGVRVSVGALVAVAVIAAAWCFFSGQGGIWYQSSDWGARNAILRDLLTYGWPVIYNDGVAAMSYYIAYWLPVALPGHILYALGVSLDAVWTLSNVLLFAWTFAGVYLSELLILCLIRPKRTWGAILCALGPIFFATPDLLGIILTGNSTTMPIAMHLEWWAQQAQISSMTTCLFWVFNQTVIPWLCTLCFLQERSLRNYVFLGACCFASGPMPCVGLFLLMLVFGLSYVCAGVRAHSWLRRLYSLASVPNVTYLVLALVFACFFLVNSAVNSTEAMATSDNLLTYPLWVSSNQVTRYLIFLFILVEGLLIPVLILPDHWRNPVFWAIVATLSLAAFVKIGQSADFCMRATIPAVMALYVLCALSLKRYIGRIRQQGGIRRVAAVARLSILAVVLLMGAATPGMEFYRGFCTMAENNWQAPVEDWGTLAVQDLSTSNFGATNYRDTIFFKYLA